MRYLITLLILLLPLNSFADQKTWGDHEIEDTLLLDSTMTLSTGSIVDTTGDIDFDNENLITTGTGTFGEINLETTDKVEFRDADIYIQSTDDGWLNLIADVGVEINAPILNASAAYVVGTGTFGNVLHVPTSSITCNSDAEGMIMYDSDDDFFYGCDGTDWDKLTN